MSQGRRIIGTLLIAGLAAVAPLAARAAAADPYLFKGIPFGISPDAYAKRLDAAGFKQTAVSDDRNYEVFAGKLAGTYVTVVTYVPHTPTVEKTAVYAGNDPKNAIALFDQIRDRLAHHHGEPQYDDRSFEPPYRAGDGREVEAFAAHKARYQAAWDGAPGPNGNVDAIILSIDPQSHVRIVFQTKAWGRYVAAMRAAKAGGATTH